MKFKNFYELCDEEAIELRRNPDDFTRVRRVADTLYEGLMSERVYDRELPQSYFLHLVLLDVLNNTIEEDYLFPDALKSIGYDIADTLEGSAKTRSYPNAQAKTFDLLANLSRRYLEKMRDMRSYSHSIIRWLRIDQNLRLPISLGETNFWVAGNPKFPYFFNLDEALADPESAKAVQSTYLKEIQRIRGIDRLCFIEKNMGPIGAILLEPYLVTNTGLTAMFYRPGHWSDATILQGKVSHEPGNVCIVYDLAVSGGALENTANYISNNLKSKVTDAVVLYSYGSEARQRLKNRGITLHTLLDLTADQIKHMILDEYRGRIAAIANEVSTGKRNYESFVKEGIGIATEYAKTPNTMIIDK